MANSSAELVIEVTANLKALQAGFQQLDQNLKKVKDTAAKPGKIDLGIDKARSGIASLTAGVKGFVAAWASFQGLKSLAGVADQANNLQARLKLATKSQEEYIQAQKETFNIAQRSGVLTSSVVDLYTKTERATRELGVSQSALLQFTETLTKAGSITGGGWSLDAAIFQLTQGLASGTLRGQELNSVLEQSPRIAQIIADGMGVPIGALRDLAEEGKITTEVVLKAGLAAKEQIDKEFAVLPLTIERSFNQLRNAFQDFIMQADDASGASSAIAGAISTLAKRMPELISAVVAFLKVWASYTLAFKVIPGMIGSISLLRDRWKESTLALSQGAAGASKSVRLLGMAFRGLQASLVVFTLIYEAFSWLRKNFKEVEIAGIYFVRSVILSFLHLQEMAEKIAVYIPAKFQQMWTAMKNFAAATLEYIASALDAVPGRLGRALQSSADATKAAAASLRTAASEGADVEAQLDKITAAAKETREAFKKINDEQLGDAYSGSIVDREKRSAEERKKKLEEELRAQGTGINGDGAAKKDKDKNKFNANLKAAVDENALILDNIDRALAELENRYEDNLVSLNAYYAERTRLQNEALDAEISSKQQELAALKTEEQELRAEGKDNTSNIEAQSQAMTELVELSRKRGDIASTAAREQATAERELADELLQVKARLAEATGQTAEARRQQIEAEFAELLGRLRAKGDVEGIALVNRVINVEAAKANLDEIEGNISETLGNLRAQEDNIAAQIEAGLMGQFRGEEQLQTLREKSIEQLKRYKAELEAAYAAAKDPAIQAEISKRITELDTELARVTASTQVLQNHLKDIGQSGLEQFFNDVMAGTKSIGDAFRGLILQIAKDIGALAAKNVAGAIVGSLGGGGGGGFSFGDLFGKASSFLSSFFHTGGIVGQGAPMQRMVPAWAFAGAPRYHSGGIAGLKPDEVPAVLQKGEEVLTKNDPRNAANGGAGGGGGFRVVNVLDPRMAGDYLESSEGERVIMNIIGRNPGQVRQLLG